MRTKIAYHIALWLLRAVSLCPLWLLYGLSNVSFYIVYHLIGYRKRTVRENLRNAFPDRSETERRSIERKFYAHLCDLIVETVKLFTIRRKHLKRRVEVTNGELVEQLAEDGRPIVLFMGHYGNWEWMTAVTFYYRRPARSGQIYRPMRNGAMNQVFRRLRGRFGTQSIPQAYAYRTLMSLHSQGEQSLIAFIADQHPNSEVLDHWTDFLHQETAFSVGGEKIGRKTNAHFLYLEVEKPCRGRYRLTFKPIDPCTTETDYPYTVAFMRMLQETIERKPELWLWSHKRWKFKPGK